MTSDCYSVDEHANEGEDYVIKLSCIFYSSPLLYFVFSSFNCSIKCSIWLKFCCFADQRPLFIQILIVCYCRHLIHHF